ncbi:MAG: shikimate kinase, partial [Epsilonproteobacteria bacterium]|nr:shikimate kinase [Campylobacterota bacterium]
MGNNIVIIGFMGVGKGSLARELFNNYNIFAIDTDDLIESLTNKQIKEIFKKKGEIAFRELEQKCANWIEQSVQNSLISAGGGFYKVSNINSLGKIVLLDASFGWIYERII